MTKLINAIKQFLGRRRATPAFPHGQRGQEAQFVGRSSIKEIEQAPPERVGELVGHAPERVDT